jgi:hypothetical protein
MGFTEARLALNTVRRLHDAEFVGLDNSTRDLGITLPLQHHGHLAGQRAGWFVLEDLSFDALDRTEKHVVVDETQVRQCLDALSKVEHLSRFIL